MTDDEIPIECGWCGAELDELGEAHVCEEGMNVARALETGDASHILGGGDL